MAADQGMLDVASLEQFLERVSSYTANLIYTRRDLQQIHHYTDLGGLSGIVVNQDLWLTNARFSNDDEEMSHGYGVARQVIAQRLANRPKAAEKACLERLSAMLAASDAEAVYICCFCKRGDLLSQWRGYGANGTGVSIGFDPAGFSFITGPDSPRFGLVRLWSVFYDDAKQRNIVNEAILFGMQTGTSPDMRARRAADAIRFFIPTFKNPQFAEEEELRLIFTPDPARSPPAPDFRVARGMLVPYYRLQALHGDRATRQPLPIRSVRVGPSTSKLLNAQAARMLLAKANMAAVPVDVSETPYRG